MQRQGFEWEPEAAYPAEAVLDVARYLQIQPSPGKRGSAANAARNSGRASALGPDERDRYFQALVGEPSAAIDFVESHAGELPPEEDSATFATGGCRGAADAADGSIWDLRRELGQELSSLHAGARATPEFATAQNRYRVCAAEQGLEGVGTPADVDRALSDGAQRAAEAVATRCSAIWRAADEAALGRAAEAFRKANGPALERQQWTYGDALSRLRQDRAFLQFLAESADPGALQPLGPVTPEREAQGF
jgi:hypothetical protein